MPTMTIDRFKRGLAGRRCAIERRENDWNFDFGGGFVVAVSSPWRMVGKDRIACTSSDFEGHTPSPGGLGSHPFLKQLLKGRRVAGVDLDMVTGDLRVTFDTGLHLDVFTDSVAYEAWVASFSIDGQPAVLVGGPGGGCAIPTSMYYGEK